MGPTVIVIGVVLALLWVLFAIPARRRQRSHLAMQDEIALGDEIITAGGIHGYVRELGDDVITVEIAPQIRVRLDRRAVAAVVHPDEAEEEIEEEPEIERVDG